MVRTLSKPPSKRLRKGIAKVARYRAAATITRAAKAYLSRKRGGSTSRRQTIQKIRPAAQGCSFSSFTKYGKPQRGLGFFKKTCAPRVYCQNQGATLKVAQNKQNYHEVRWFNDTDMSALYSLVTSGLDGSAVTGAPDLRIYLDEGMCEYLITNAANTNLFVDIFELTCRRDQNLGATVSATTNAIYTSSPIGAIDQGLYELSATLTANSLGFGPFDSRQFTGAWKCDKWMTIELAPGKTHKHMSKFKIGRTFDKDRQSENQNYANFTRSLMIRARGQPVADATTDTNVALSEGELNIVMIRKLKMMVGANPCGYASIANNLSTVTARMYNEDTGALTNYLSV